MDPFTIGAILSIGGGLLSAGGQIASGQAAEAAGEYNASVYLEKAKVARWQGNIDLREQQKTAARTIGTARAGYANSGVSSGEGSALDVLQESARTAALDEIKVKTDTAYKVRGLEQSAEQSLLDGRAKAGASNLAAAGSLLDTGAKFLGKM